MDNFKNELKQIASKTIFSSPGDLSKSAFLICYGTDKFIISISKLLEVCDNEDELTVEKLLSASNRNANTPDVSVIGEIRLIDSSYNILFRFSLKNKADDGHLFERYLYDNLLMADCAMPKFLYDIVNIVSSKGINRSSEILNQIISSNPLCIDSDWKENFYRFKIGRLLYIFTLGMTEVTVWDGKVPNGGIICITGSTCTGFNYFDQSSIGDYLIASTEFKINKSYCYIKLLKS